MKAHATTIALTVLLAAQVARAEDGAPNPDGAPPGYGVFDAHPRSELTGGLSRLSKGLIISGSITFGAAYLFTAVGGGLISQREEGLEPVFIPGIGPWIAMGTMENLNGTAAGLLVGSGLLQAVGLALLIPGISVAEHQVTERVNMGVRVGPGDVTASASF